MTKKPSVWKKPPTFTSKKLDWLACINFDRRLKQFPTVFKVAYVIANQVDETRNTAFISDAAIADKAGGISERQVGRSRKLLRDTGWLSWKRTYSANVYSLLSEHVSGVRDSITASNEERKERRRKRRSDWKRHHFTSRSAPKSTSSHRTYKSDSKVCDRTYKSEGDRTYKSDIHVREFTLESLRQEKED
jgi:hypothetical protein